MKLIPKKNKLAIPNLGVIAKEDFNDKHLAHLKAWAKENNVPFEKIVKTNFDIVAEDGQFELPTGQDTELLEAPAEDVVNETEELAEEVAEEVTEQPKKRTRRTKAQIEADKEAE